MLASGVDSVRRALGLSFEGFPFGDEQLQSLHPFTFAYLLEKEFPLVAELVKFKEGAPIAHGHFVQYEGKQYSDSAWSVLYSLLKQAGGNLSHVVSYLSCPKYLRMPTREEIWRAQRAQEYLQWIPKKAEGLVRVAVFTGVNYARWYLPFSKGFLPPISRLEQVLPDRIKKQQRLMSSVIVTFSLQELREIYREAFDTDDLTSSQFQIAMLVIDSLERTSREPDFHTNLQQIDSSDARVSALLSLELRLWQLVLQISTWSSVDQSAVDEAYKSLWLIQKDLQDLRQEIGGRENKIWELYNLLTILILHIKQVLYRVIVLNSNRDSVGALRALQEWNPYPYDLHFGSDSKHL